jgi:predicted O-linked N-acetylglucosamine transferase (SPINDLY family)
VLAFRPAPIQVNYLGYPGTMGRDYLDYIIADRLVIPEENRIYYSEKVVYLPDTYQANTKRKASDKIFTRAEAGLPQSGFVFCSFNNTYKIMPEIFDIWMRLLHQVEDSVLWLFEDNSYASANLLRAAQARGIASERLIFATRMKTADHMARQRLADLFLDTLPYNAHTTASDALWMGLPVLTCPGHTFPARVAASLLHAIGLPELVSDSLTAYEALALDLARHPARLGAIKMKLAAQRDTFPLFDTGRFTRNLEAAFTEMWRRHQNGAPPESFSVPRP